MGQCNFLGQRDRNFFIVPGKRDDGTSSPWNRTGRDSLSKSCHRMGRVVTASQNPVRDTGWDIHYFSIKIRDFCSSYCPATTGQQDEEIFFVPGQRDSGTRIFFCPRTKGQRDVPSLGNPNSNCVRPNLGT